MFKLRNDIYNFFLIVNNKIYKKMQYNNNNKQKIIRMVQIQEVFCCLWHRCFFSVLLRSDVSDRAAQCWSGRVMWVPGSFWGPLAGSPGTCWVFSFSSQWPKTCSTGGAVTFFSYFTRQLPFKRAPVHASPRWMEGPRAFLHVLWSFALIWHEHKAHTETVPPGLSSTRAFGAPQMSAGHPSFRGVVTMTTGHLTAAAHNGMLWCDRDDREVLLADRWMPALEEKSSETWADAKNWRLMEDVGGVKWGTTIKSKGDMYDGWKDGICKDRGGEKWLLFLWAEQSGSKRSRQAEGNHIPSCLSPT